MFTSDVGIVSAPIMAGEGTAAKLLGGTFLADMVRQMPSQYKDGIAALKRGDYETATKSFAGLALTGTMVHAAASPYYKPHLADQTIGPEGSTVPEVNRDTLPPPFDRSAPAPSAVFPSEPPASRAAPAPALPIILPPPAPRPAAPPQRGDELAIPRGATPEEAGRLRAQAQLIPRTTQAVAEPISGEPTPAKNVPATITGSNEGKASEMSAEAGGSPAPEQSLSTSTGGKPSETATAPTLAGPSPAPEVAPMLTKGDRVTRKDTGEKGTVISSLQGKNGSGPVRVTWDDGSAREIHSSTLEKSAPPEVAPPVPESAAPEVKPAEPPPVTTGEKVKKSADVLPNPDEAPDFFDVLDSVTSGPVKFSPEQAGHIDNIRTTVSQELYGKDYENLTAKQRQRVDKNTRMGHDAGQPADQVLRSLAENPKYANWTPDDLAEAMSRSAQHRAESGGLNSPETRMERFRAAASRPTQPSQEVFVERISPARLKPGMTFRLRAKGLSNDTFEVIHSDPSTGELQFKSETLGTVDWHSADDLWIEKGSLQETFPGMDTTGSVGAMEATTPPGKKPEIIGRDQTSTLFAMGEITRARHGLEERPPTEVQAMVPSWERAKKFMQENPKGWLDYVQGLVKRLREDPSNILHDDEIAHGLLYKTNLEKEINDLSEKTFTGTPEEVKSDLIHIDRLRGELDVLMKAMDPGVTHAARLLRWQQSFAGEDYSFTHRLDRLEGAMQRKATPEEVAQLAKELKDEREYSKILEDAKLASDQKLKESRAEVEFERLEKEAAKEETGQPKYHPRLIEKAEELIKGWKARIPKLDAEIEDLWKSIDMSRASGGPDTVLYGKLIARYAEKGAIHLAEGALAFGKWADRMRKSMGDRASEMEPHLEEIFRQSNKQLDENLKAADKTHKGVTKAVKRRGEKDMDLGEREQVSLDKIKSKVDSGELKGVNLYAQKLAKIAAARGAKGWRAITDAVHEKLKEIIPGLDYGKTMDMILGENEFKPLSTAEADVNYRQGRQEIRAIKDIQQRAHLEESKRKVPPKHGPAIQEYSQYRRMLEKVTNAIKKRFPVEAIDPARQQASFLSARKKRYDNIIADLEQEIKTKQRINRDRGVPPTDPELDAKIARTKQLRTERDEIFGTGLTDAQKLKRYIAVMDRQSAEFRRKRDAGEFVGKEEPSAGWKKDPAATAAKARRDADQAAYEEARDLDEHFQRQQELQDLQSQKDALEKKIQAQRQRLAEGPPGKEPVASDRPGPTAELEKMRLESEDLARRIQEAEHPRKTPGELEAEKIAAIQKRIDAVELEVNEGIRAEKKAGASTASPERLAKQEELKALTKIRDTLRRAEKGKTAAEKEADAISAVEARSAIVADEINRGEIEAKKSPGKPVSPALAAAREELAELQKIKAQLRRAAVAKTPEQIALSAYKTRMANETAKQAEHLAELDKALKDGTLTQSDLKPKRKYPKTDVFKDPAAVAAWRKRQAVRDAVDLREHQAERELRSPAKKVVDRFVGFVARAPIGLAVAAHGTALMLTHAGGYVARVTRWRQFWPAFFRQYALVARKAEYHDRLMFQHINDEFYPLAVRAKLAIEPHKIYTDADWFAQVGGKLAQFGAKGMDSLKFFRLAVFKKEWSKVPEWIKDDPQLGRERADMIARMVNNSTGAYELGTGATPKVLRSIFFAPSLYASRWDRVLVDPVRVANAYLKGSTASVNEKAMARTKIVHAAEFVGVYAGLLALNAGLLKATNSDQEVNIFNPGESDWLKFKAANHTIAIDGGLLDPLRFLGRIIAHDMLGKRSKWEQLKHNRIEQALLDSAKYGFGKANPGIAVAAELGFGQDRMGNTLPNSDEKPQKYRRELTWAEWASQHGPIFTSGASRVIVEEMVANGFSEMEAKTWLKAAAELVVGSTGAHASPDYKVGD
jgi:hypothetical protein